MSTRAPPHHPLLISIMMSCLFFCLKLCVPTTFIYNFSRTFVSFLSLKVFSYRVAVIIIIFFFRCMARWELHFLAEKFSVLCHSFVRWLALDLKNNFDPRAFETFHLKLHIVKVMQLRACAHGHLVQSWLWWFFAQQNELRQAITHMHGMTALIRNRLRAVSLLLENPRKNANNRASTKFESQVPQASGRVARTWKASEKRNFFRLPSGSRGRLAPQISCFLFFCFFFLFFFPLDDGLNTFLTSCRATPLSQRHT